MKRIKITKHTSDSKMDKMLSVSTSPLMNNRCLKRSQNCNSICSKCYSFTMNKMYKGLKKNLMYNTELLTTEKIEPEIINCAFFRFEAFGDLINIIQLDNYISIVNKNKHCKFALWTKNLDIINRYFKTHKKPVNLQINYSSPIINKRADITKLKHVNRCFTVYTKEFAIEHNININCGKKHCIDCQLCYKKNNVQYINELTK